MYNILIY